MLTLCCMPYMEYERHQNMHTTPKLHGAWQMKSSGGVGVRLLAAFTGEETGLEDPDGTIIVKCGPKIRYCISVWLFSVAMSLDVH